MNDIPFKLIATDLKEKDHFKKNCPYFSHIQYEIYAINVTKTILQKRTTFHQHSFIDLAILSKMI